MDNYLQYHTKEGIVVPDTTTLVDDTWEAYKAKFGQDLITEEASPQGRLVELEALAKKFALGVCALTANQINPDYAAGVFLDAIASLFNVSRKAASPTTVSCTISGKENTPIPRGTEISDNNGNTFVAEGVSYIPAGGKIVVVFTCTKNGAIEVPAGSITIPPDIPGVESIHQYSNGIVGTEEESDLSLSSRLKEERYTGKSLFQNIGAALSEVDGVIAYRVYNNGTGSSITVGTSVTVDPHSILVIVLGGDDNEIGRALINNVSAGCGYTALTNATTIPVGFGGEDNSLSVNNVTFNRPVPVDLYASITARKNNYTGDDLEADIKQFLVDWSANVYHSTFANLIGDKISVFYLSNAIQSTLGCIVDDLQIGLSDDSLSYSEITLDANELASFESDNIVFTLA